MTVYDRLADVTAEDRQYDVVVVGAGTTGITLALELFGRGMTVVVLERGGRRSVQNFHTKSCLIEGLPFDGLAERGVGVGGTSEFWAGQCMEFDAEDFQRRDWIPGSGWPISKSALEPYYARARVRLGVDQESGNQLALKKSLRLGLDQRVLRLRASVFADRPRMGDEFLRVCTGSKGLDLVLNSRAKRFIRSDSDSVQVQAGQQGDLDRLIHAKLICLAAGAIENARLLLTPSCSFREGLNFSGLVGRHFQDHPNLPIAQIFPTDYRMLQANLGVLEKRSCKMLPKVALAPQAQQQVKSLNVGAVFEWRYNADSATARTRALANAVAGKRFDADALRGSADLLPDTLKVLRHAIARRGIGSGFERPDSIFIHGFVEQDPLGPSNVSLGEHKDQDGVPATKVDWYVGEHETLSLRALQTALSNHFERRALGRVLRLDLGESSATSYNDNNHHAGTTRMASTAADGVVDSNCKVFGVSNVYVTGGAVFPTSSFMNPTLTMVAFAIRLADRLFQVSRS